jgi:hypothetical protein
LVLSREDSKCQTLSTSLQLLANEDPLCLFIVRRINKLGFKAARKLKHHFATYGTVVQVLVAHSTVRQHGTPPYYSRRRPSSLGFVHMSDQASVQQVLNLGLEQEVDGTVIRVQRFERQHAVEEGDEEAEDNADQQADAGDAHAASNKEKEAEQELEEALSSSSKWVRSQSGKSGPSTGSISTGRESTGEQQSNSTGSEEADGSASGTSSTGDAQE